jgi:hypothetical protein
VIVGDSQLFILKSYQEVMMGKLFVRERGNVGKGEGRPRFEIVGVTEVDLKVYHSHVRKIELEKIAEILGAEIIYLPRAGGSEGEAGPKGGRGRRRKGGRTAEQE